MKKLAIVRFGFLACIFARNTPKENINKALVLLTFLMKVQF
jgi:hypothetical protein